MESIFNYCRSCIKTQHSIKSFQTFGLVLYLGAMFIWSAKAVAENFNAENREREINSYKTCRQEAVNSSEAESDLGRRAEILREASSECKQVYPLIDMLLECRQKALKELLQGEELQVRLSKCKSIYESIRFQSGNVNPINPVYGDTYFASIDIDRALDLQTRGLIDGKRTTTLKTSKALNCSNLKRVLDGADKPQYLFFGNFLRTYKPSLKIATKKLAQSFKPESSEDGLQIVSGKFGRLQWGAKDNNVIHSPPLGFCTLNIDTRGFYRGIKLYYLVDREGSKVLPYLGLAHYKKNKSINRSYLRKKLVATLGGSYREVRMVNGISILADGEIDEFDKEGFPFNICKDADKFKKIALIKTFVGSDEVDYVGLANIENLCSQSQRLVGNLMENLPK